MQTLSQAYVRSCVIALQLTTYCVFHLFALDSWIHVLKPLSSIFFPENKFWTTWKHLKSTPKQEKRNSRIEEFNFKSKLESCLGFKRSDFPTKKIETDAAFKFLKPIEKWPLCTSVSDLSIGQKATQMHFCWP